MKRALILSDDKPGHVNQSLALAQIMHWEVEIIRVQFKSRAAKTLSYGMDLGALYIPSLLEPIVMPNQRPDIIISAGSETYYANKYLSRLWKVPNIAILLPRGYRLDFTHIFAPSYDHPPDQPNITSLPINLTQSDASWYHQQTELFRTYHPNQKKPSIGVAIGGNSKHATLDSDDLKKQLDEIFSRHAGHSFWVTTSRRTPADIISLIKTYPFEYMLIWREDAFNPLPAFIANCDHLYLTADSASMISEAVSFGSASVNLLPVNFRTKNKLHRFTQQLCKEGYANSLSESMATQTPKVHLQELIKSTLRSQL